jgi:hypothetical protein
VKPVFQDRYGSIDGNCFEACLASLLELPLGGVPELGGDDVYEDNLARFLAGQGCLYVLVRGPSNPELGILTAMFKQGDVYHTIEGVSPRGGPHAVVGLNGRAAHDPHEGGGGLMREDGWGFLLRRL